MLSLQQEGSGHQWGEETGKAGQAKLWKRPSRLRSGSVGIATGRPWRPLLRSISAARPRQQERFSRFLLILSLTICRGVNIEIGRFHPSAPLDSTLDSNPGISKQG